MPSSGDCVNGLAQLPSRDGKRGRKSCGSTGCNENTQLAPSEINRSPKSADGRVATAFVGAQSKNGERNETSERRLPFLPDGMVTDRSSPSRVRYAAQNAPLTAPGRSAHSPARKEREILGKAKQNLLDLDRVPEPVFQYSEDTVTLSLAYFCCASCFSL